MNPNIPFEIKNWNDGREKECEITIADGSKIKVNKRHALEIAKCLNSLYSK